MLLFTCCESCSVVPICVVSLYQMTWADGSACTTQINWASWPTPFFRVWNVENWNFYQTVQCIHLTSIWINIFTLAPIFTLFLLFVLHLYVFVQYVICQFLSFSFLNEILYCQNGIQWLIQLSVHIRAHAQQTGWLLISQIWLFRTN